MPRQHHHAEALRTEQTRSYRGTVKRVGRPFWASRKDQAETYKLLQRAEQVARLKTEARRSSWKNAKNRSLKTEQQRQSVPKRPKMPRKLDIFARAMHLGVSNLSDQEQRAFKGMAVETRGTSTQISGTAGLGSFTLCLVLLQNEIIKLMKLYSGVCKLLGSLYIGRWPNYIPIAQHHRP